MFQFLDTAVLLQGKEGTVVQETSGANASVAITLTAVAGCRHIIPQIIWSYSAAPTGGRLTISGLRGEDIDVDVTSAGPGPFNLPPIAGSTNTDVVVTLAAAGGSVIGKLNLLYVTVGVPI